ncbi:hypothetical protein BO99DRAFT_406623 [Aspergillus violaceofuscus CBS 115571]|uniref:Uncharacterized protein n=1 Tax=Aspergillus violaceofuscus (strain CBS 115571) TaxID=1450538 RepID=A0A2V5GYZ2_ASPV1|nr:hypothetical protein BO99DRAFT_406623 [Aspergillus violaceofuscus CBS 115571]
MVESWLSLWVLTLCTQSVLWGLILTVCCCNVALEIEKCPQNGGLLLLRVGPLQDAYFCLFSRGIYDNNNKAK